MDNNDILEMLQSYVCHTSSDYDRKQDVIKMAKELVERDEPKKVEVNTLLMVRLWVCPTCGARVCENFCGNCGQRLKWWEDDKHVD